MERRNPETRRRSREREEARAEEEHALAIAERFRDSHRKVGEYLWRTGEESRALAEYERAAHYARRVEQIRARRETA